MSRENGDSQGLWPARGRGRAARPQRPRHRARRPNGDRAERDRDRRAPPARSTAAERRRVHHRADDPTRPPSAPSGGWRRALFSLTGGLVAIGPSPAELRRRELVATVKTPITGCRKVAFISRKGGVGKTTTCLLVGPHVRRSTAATASSRSTGTRTPARSATGSGARRPRTSTSLLADAQQDRAVRRHPRLHVAGAEPARGGRRRDDDPRITQAIGEAEFQPGDRDCSSATTTSSASTPATGVLDSADRGILDAADQIVVVSAPSLDGARAASSTLDWLDENGHDGPRPRSAVAVLNAVATAPVRRRPRTGSRSTSRARCRACVRIPWDPHLEAGAEADLDELRAQTRGTPSSSSPRRSPRGFTEPTERRS